jgi:hypothetical protein
MAMRTAIPRSEVAGMVKTMAVATVHQVIGTQVANKVAVPCLQVSISKSDQRIGNYNPYWG